MSIFNEVQEQGLNQLLVRRLQLAGQSSPAPALAPEIFPTFEVEGEKPEHAYLKGDRLLGAQATAAAVAAQTSRFTLWNPPSSGIICVLEFVEFDYAGAVLALMSIGERTTQPTGGGVAEVARDGRWAIGTGGLAGGGMCLCNAGASVAGFANNIYWAGNVGAGVRVTNNLPVILPPGWVWELSCGTVNTALNRCAIAYRERPAGNGELR